MSRTTPSASARCRFPRKLAILFTPLSPDDPRRLFGDCRTTFTRDQQFESGREGDVGRAGKNVVVKSPSYCAEQVRQFDHDRFLTAIFAPAAVREHLFALYAFNIE